METLILEPSILTQNTYFWKPIGNSQQRSRNEARIIEEIREWLYKLGFTVKYTTSGVEGILEDLCFNFSYTESSNYVYKKTYITYKNRKVNLIQFRKILKYIKI